MRRNWLSARCTLGSAAPMKVASSRWLSGMSITVAVPTRRPWLTPRWQSTWARRWLTGAPLSAPRTLVAWRSLRSR